MLGIPIRHPAFVRSKRQKKTVLHSSLIEHIPVAKTLKVCGCSFRVSNTWANYWFRGVTPKDVAQFSSDHDVATQSCQKHRICPLYLSPLERCPVPKKVDICRLLNLASCRSSISEGVSRQSGMQLLNPARASSNVEHFGDEPGVLPCELWLLRSSNTAGVLADGPTPSTSDVMSDWRHVPSRRGDWQVMHEGGFCRFCLSC